MIFPYVKYRLTDRLATNWKAVTSEQDSEWAWWCPRQCFVLEQCCSSEVTPLAAYLRQWWDGLLGNVGLHKHNFFQGKPIRGFDANVHPLLIGTWELQTMTVPWDCFRPHGQWKLLIKTPQTKSSPELEPDSIQAAHSVEEGF